MESPAGKKSDDLRETAKTDSNLIKTNLKRKSVASKNFKSFRSENDERNSQGSNHRINTFNCPKGGNRLHDLALDGN